MNKKYSQVWAAWKQEEAPMRLGHSQAPLHHSTYTPVYCGIFGI
jgi:hypothetical protein